MDVIESVDSGSRDKINSALASTLKGVRSWSSPVVGYCSAAGTAVVVSHDLGKVPNDIDVKPYVDGRHWADDDDRKLWSSTIIVFHASAVGKYSVRAGIV